MKFSIVIVGIAALLLSACGNMGKAATSTAAAGVASPRPTRGPGQNGVAGQITNVSTGSLVVKAQSGDVNVAFGSSTGVLKTSTGALSDIVAGACTLVTGQRDAGGAITAFMVQVQLNMNGNCTTPGIGQGQGQGTPPSGGGNFGGQANGVAVRGKIATVSGSSFVVQPVTAGDTPVTVNVPSTARITKLEIATTSTLAVGQCVRATGQRDNAGAVQARSLVITPAGPNGCTFGFGGGGPRPAGTAST